jgi:hypothetical protein
MDRNVNIVSDVGQKLYVVSTYSVSRRIGVLSTVGIR